jgi:nucleoside-diphosphate-sugar epimerase
MRRILITGGAGFIGSHLIEALAGKAKIAIYDTFERDALRFLAKPDVFKVKADILDYDRLKGMALGVDVIIHCAAIAGIRSVNKNSARTMDVNLVGTMNVLRAAKDHHVPLVINFSTSEVYGPRVYDEPEAGATSQGPATESRWIYAVSKLAAEHLAQNFGKENGISVVTVRPFNIFGPRQVGEGAIHDMIISALRNEPVTVYNGGTQIRSWCYISDFVDAIMAILDFKSMDSEVFNVGNPQNTLTVYNLAKMIINMTGSKAGIVHAKSDMPDVHLRVPNIDKARLYFGFNPSVGLEDGLVKTIEWYREHL